MEIIDRIGHALMLAAGMFWQTGWRLVLAFTVQNRQRPMDHAAHHMAAD